MYLKYSPVKYNEHSPACAGHKADTEIAVQDENTILVDGEVYEFDPLDVAWPTISEDTGGVILEAHREDGMLFVTVRRFYTLSCAEWDDGQCHEVKA
jgi:hypothetical protein